MTSQTMRAARMHGPRSPLTIVDVPPPHLEADEVRIEVKAAGVCATELHFLDGFYDPTRFPMTLGHEVAGIVVETGDEATQIAIGQRVVANYYLFCGTCRWCQSGDHNLCTTPRGWMAFQSDGGFAEQVVVPEYCVVPIPDSLDFVDAAPICCSITTSLHAAKRAHVTPNECAVVIGAGGVGQGLIQVLDKLYGARVVAVDKDPDAREAARHFGAVAAVDVHDAQHTVETLTGGRGCDLVFEFVGRAATLELSLSLLGPRGRLMLVGYTEDQLTAAPFALIAKEQSILTSAGNTHHELRLAVDLVARGIVKSAVTRTFAFDDIDQALSELRNGNAHGRLVLTF